MKFDFFNKLNPGKKRNVIFLIGIIGIFLFLYLLVNITTGGDKKKQKKNHPKFRPEKYINILSPKQADNKFMISKMQSELRLSNKEKKELKNQLKEVTQKMEKLTEGQKKMEFELENKKTELTKTFSAANLNQKEDIENQIKNVVARELEKYNVRGIQKKLMNFQESVLGDKKLEPRPAGISDNPFNDVNPYTAENNQFKNDLKNIGNTVKQSEIKVYGQSDAEKQAFVNSITKMAKNKKESEKLSHYIPTGSLLRGIMISGVDAPTGGNAQNNPHPILIYLNDSSWLPNGFQKNLEGCHVLASGWGDMSTHRAFVRTERLSCVYKNGYTVDIAIKGNLIDVRDGKLGVFGTLESRAGSMLAKSMASGLLAGFSSALTPRATLSVDTDPGSNYLYQTPDMKGVLQSGSYQGASNALDRLAKYYQTLAEKAVPVIAIKPGLEIEIMIQSGFVLKMKESLVSS